MSWDFSGKIMWLLVISTAVIDIGVIRLFANPEEVMLYTVMRGVENPSLEGAIIGATLK